MASVGRKIVFARRHQAHQFISRWEKMRDSGCSREDQARYLVTLLLTHPKLAKDIQRAVIALDTDLFASVMRTLDQRKEFFN